MYIEGSEEYKHHIATYGTQDKFGYHGVTMRSTAQQLEIHLERGVLGRVGASRKGIHEREARGMADHAAEEGVSCGTNDFFH